MTLRPCIFLDRDGVLNHDRGYVFRPEDFTWIDGAREVVRQFNDAGWLVIVVTNQSGIGRGYFTKDEMDVLHVHMQKDLAAIGAHIDAFYFAPYHPEAVLPEYRRDHPDRKPGTGMIERAIRDWRIDRSRSFLVGDKDTDGEAAQRAGLAFHLFRGDNLEIFLTVSGRLPSHS